MKSSRRDSEVFFSNKKDCPPTPFEVGRQGRTGGVQGGGHGFVSEQRGSVLGWACSSCVNLFLVCYLKPGIWMGSQLPVLAVLNIHSD